MTVYVFGNGNLCFSAYLQYYQTSINKLMQIHNPHFVLCDFKGVDTLTMELLKCITPNVTLLHIGETPRYLPDKYKTQVNQWKIISGFQSDRERDSVAIAMCTHYLAYDFNSNENRKSGTLKNIETCLAQNKIDIRDILL